MVPVMSLLVPILAAAAIVFVASSVIHMFTPIHKGDLKRVPNEDGVMSALRTFNLAPGDYAMPLPASMAAMGSPEFQAKMAAGPVVESMDALVDEVAVWLADPSGWAARHDHDRRRWAADRCGPDDGASVERAVRAMLAAGDST